MLNQPIKRRMGNAMFLVGLPVRDTSGYRLRFGLIKIADIEIEYTVFGDQST